MKLLYIGQYTEGSTSRMRADKINKILNPGIFDIIDIHVPFFNTNRLYRSVGFRFKKGPLISKVNRYVLSEIDRLDKKERYDLIWTDKAVFLTERTTHQLRKLTKKLVHFTPDPAFAFHRSKHFLDSLPKYDYLITTKSYELKDYIKYSDKEKVIMTTQGFDKQIHIPSSGERKHGFIFIGHHEKEREEVIDCLLQQSIPVRLAGIKWKAFAARNEKNKNLTYYGNGIYGTDYVKAIANSRIAWGAISKWVPEKHTTRTFEIPACGTALLTERNEETSSFFQDDEVIFYSSTEEMVEKVQFYLKNTKELEAVTKKGYERVHRDGYDYESILRKILDQVLL